MRTHEEELAVAFTAFAHQLSHGHAWVTSFKTENVGEVGMAEVRFSYSLPLVTEPESDKTFRNRIFLDDWSKLTPLEVDLLKIVTGDALDKIGKVIGLVRHPSVPVIRYCT